MRNNSNFDHANLFLKRAGLAAILVPLVFSTSAARADFLDDLFGGGATETRAVRAPTQQRRARGAVSARHEFSIRLNDAGREARGRAHAQDRKAGPASEAHADKSDGGTRTDKARFCVANVPARSNPEDASVRMSDATLRAGDSFVTARGILVFTGRSACPHRPTEFVSVAQANLPKPKRNALLAVEQAMHASRNDLVLTSDKDVAKQVVSQAEK